MFVSKTATRVSSSLSRQAARRALPSLSVAARQPASQYIQRGLNRNVSTATLATFKIPVVENEPMVGLAKRYEKTHH